MNDLAKRRTDAALKYRPSVIRYLFVAESPPEPREARKPAYYYFLDNSEDRLFATIVYALYGVEFRKNPEVKDQLLQRMQAEGYWLMDAVDYPINDAPNEQRRAVIEKESDRFVSSLETLRSDGVINSDSGVVLIKQPVWEALHVKLASNGFRVMNPERWVPFPHCYRAANTVDAIRRALGISSDASRD